MNTIKHELVNILPTNLILIVLCYIEPYFERYNINLKNKCSAIKELNNDKIAIGFVKGFICIYDCVNKSFIYKNSKNNASNPISAIHQINDETIMCGYADRKYILIWDFVNNIEHIIDCDTCKDDSIISLSNELIGFVSRGSKNVNAPFRGHIYKTKYDKETELIIINLKEKKMIDKKITSITSFATYNDKLLYGNNTNNGDGSEYIYVIDTNNFDIISSIHLESNCVAKKIIPLKDDDMAIINHNTSGRYEFVTI